MAYKITGILTLYEVTKSDTYVSINGDIKSPDGRNLFFECDEYSNRARIVKVNEEFTISDELKYIISLIFIL